MQSNRNEIKILLMIYRSYEDLHAFTVFRKLKLPFNEYTSLLKKLKDKAYLIVDGNRLSLTSEGRDFLFKDKNRYFLSERKAWREIPDTFIGRKIKPNEFYLPSLSRIDFKEVKK